MSWRKVKLGEVCFIEKGLTGIQKAIPGEYPMVVTSEERKSHNEFQFDDEAVIIPLVSSTGHGHKSLKRIHFQQGKFALGSILCAVIPKNKSLLSAEYLYRFLDLNKENELVARMKGMANVTLPMKEIAAIEIPLPTLNDQLLFVEKYKNLENKSESLNTELTHQRSLVRQLRRQLLQEAVQGKLVPQNPADEPADALLRQIKAEKEQLIKAGKLKKDKPLPPVNADEAPFEIPEGWVWCRLGEIAFTISTGPFGTMLHKSDYVQNGIPLVNPMNIVKEKIIASEKMMVSEKTKQKLESYVLETDDIVVARRGDMGRCAVVSKNENGWICGTGSFFIKLPSEIFRPYFVKVFGSDFSKSFLLSSSVGSTMNNLNHRILNNLLIPLPPLPEQDRIVQKLEQLLQTCDALEASIQQSQEVNAQLLQQVLREALQAPGATVV